MNWKAASLAASNLKLKEQFMASAVNPIAGSSASSGAASSSSSSSGTNSLSAPSEEVFLQLLVAQLQNQDPLNPTDSTQFVSQLAQFSELEQVIAIRSDIENYASQSSTAAAASSTDPTADPNAASGGTSNTDASNTNSNTNNTSST
jgi:flagellar basal-body rod modification protein FlgD